MEKTTLFGLNSDKYEEAYDNFEKAYNLCIMNKDITGADDCLNNMLKCCYKICKPDTKQQKDMNLLYDVLNRYGVFLIDKRNDYEYGIKLLNCALKYLEQTNDVMKSIKIHIRIYQTYMENNKKQDAINEILKCISVCQIDENKFSTQIRDSKTTLAEIYVGMSKFDLAKTLYEEIADMCIDNNLLKFSVSKFIFLSILCEIANKRDDCKNIIDEYGNKYPIITNSREFTLLTKLVDAIDNCDLTQFSNFLHDYDSISKLSDTHIKILTCIREKMERSTERVGTFTDFDDPEDLC